MLLLAHATPGSAQTSDASAEFRRCAVLFGTERFPEAAECFTHAYELGGDPSMLYNLARARERAGQSEGAIEAYRGYLSARPEAPERAEVEASLAALEAARPPTIEPEDEPREIVPEPIAPVSATPHAQVEGPDLLGPALIAGLGVGGVGVALGLSLHASAVHDAAVTEPVQLRAAALGRDADGLALGANVAWVAAGVLAGVGVVWAIVEYADASQVDDTPATAPSARLSITPMGLALDATF